MKSNPKDACEKLIQFTCPSKFVEAEKLIDGCDILKLNDDSIDDFIRLDGIIDAFTLLILDSYQDKAELPPSIVKLNTDETSMSIEEFINKHFHKTKYSTNCIHMSKLKQNLAKYEYKLSPANIRKKFETLKIGDYEAKHCSMDGKESSGFNNVKYVNADDDGVYEDL